MAERGRLAGVAKRLEIRNCTVYIGEQTSSGNPILNAVSGGYGGTVVGGVLNPALAPVGAVIGAVSGAASALTPHEIWCMDIHEFDGTDHTFRLESKLDGDKLLAFLETHYSL